MARKEDDVAGVEPLLLHEAAPPLGQDVALAAVPIRVSEPPRLPAVVLEAQQQPFLSAAVQGKVLLGLLLRYHKAVELANVARGQGLLKQGLFGEVVFRGGAAAVVHRRLQQQLLFVFIVEVEAERRARAAEHGGGGGGAGPDTGGGDGGDGWGFC